MGKAGKVFTGLVIAAIAVIAIVLVLVLQNLDAIIKQVIEGVGSDVTGTSVRVSDVKFSLQDGRGEIYGLTIGNPPGYSSGDLFEMDEIAVQVQPASVTGPVIIINEVLVDGARLNAEQKGARTNLKDLLDGMQAGAPKAEQPADDSPAAVRLMLESFAFVNSSATIKTAQYGEKTLKIPDVRLSNIGDKETGLTPEQLSAQMLKAVVKQAEKAVGNYLEDLVKDAARKEVNKQLDEKIGAENREKLEGLKDMFKKDK